MNEGSPVEELSLYGGALCLDFVNSVDGRRGGVHHDYLQEYADLVRWTVHAEALTAAEAVVLLAAARASPDAAQAVYAATIVVREALYQILLAVSTGGEPSGADLRTLNAAIGQAFAHLALRLEDEGIVWAWTCDTAALDRPLWPVVRSAAELLVSAERVHIHACGSEDCGWLFLDTTKNHTRRWCSMAGCGSRAKARRYYARQRQREPGLEHDGQSG